MRSIPLALGLVNIGSARTPDSRADQESNGGNHYCLLLATVNSTKQLPLESPEKRISCAVIWTSLTQAELAAVTAYNLSEAYTKILD